MQRFNDLSNSFVCWLWGFLGPGVAVLKCSVKTRCVNLLGFKARFYELEKTCSASVGSLTPAQTRGPDVPPRRCSALQSSPRETLPPLWELCTRRAQPGCPGHSLCRGDTAQIPAFQSPGTLCRGTRGEPHLRERRKSKFCKYTRRGTAVGWPRKGWRAAKCSSLGQTVQEEKWPRKSFLGSFHEHLRRVKPSRDTCPQPYV